MPIDAAPPLRALIVDDEAPGRANLRYMLAAHPGWAVAGECASAAAARQMLALGGIDVVFLDIQMPGESGLSLARSLCGQAEPPLIVFVTAYSAHAVDAFELHALDYLLKPLRVQRLAQALERAAQLLALRQRAPYAQAVQAWLAHDASSAFPRQLAVRSVGKLEWVALDQVLWIAAANNYVELHTAQRTILHRLSLSKLEQLLDPQLFQRVHRGAIVRRDQFGTLAAQGDGSYLLSLRCGARLAVSAPYLAAVRSHTG